MEASAVDRSDVCQFLMINGWTTFSFVFENFWTPKFVFCFVNNWVFRKSSSTLRLAFIDNNNIWFIWGAWILFNVFLQNNNPYTDGQRCVAAKKENLNFGVHYSQGQWRHMSPTNSRTDPANGISHSAWSVCVLKKFFLVPFNKYTK